MDSVISLLDLCKNNIAKGIRTKYVDLTDAISELTSYLISAGRDKENGFACIELLAAFAADSVLSIKERWALYQYLERLTFVDADFYDVDKYLRPSYRELFYAVKSEVDKCTPQIVEKYMSLLTVPENSVYIITDQFLSSGHAPTRDVLDYAYTIQKDLGYNVALVNVGLLNFENVDYIAGRTVFKFKESLNNIGAYEFKDVTFPFYQAGCVMPDVQELTNLISFISFKKPALVFSVGGPNLLCDLLRDSVKTASIPCHTYLPRSMSDNLILCKDMSHVDKLQLDMLEDRQRVIQSVFNYGAPDDMAGKIYTKDELGIDDNSFDIAVVGNRLTLEIDDKFLMLVDEILSMNERIKIHIIGGFEGDISGKISNTDRFIMHGKIDNAVMAIKLMKLIVQPSRTGGARAAYEALHFGIPAITTKMGDTWDVCGDEFAVDNYEEMMKLVLKYATDEKFYSIMSDMAKKRSVILEDLKGTFAQIFADMGMLG